MILAGRILLLVVELIGGHPAVDIGATGTSAASLTGSDDRGRVASKVVTSARRPR
jgi:hypothetical protein